jgi:hypothetical protein
VGGQRDHHRRRVAPSRIGLSYQDFPIGGMDAKS